MVFYFLLFTREKMNNNIKIAILGGTGKAGHYLVKELLRRGYSLRLLLRNPAKYPNPSQFIELIVGDARQYKAVRAVTEGCQAVISTLGQPAGEPSIFSEATQNVLRAMEQWEIKRYILTTGLNVDTPTDHKSGRVQAATDWMKTNYPETTLDKQREYELLMESPIDWTLVRLPLIQLTDEPIETLVNLGDCPGEQVSATSLARFLTAQLTETTYVRQALFLANT